MSRDPITFQEDNSYEEPLTLRVGSWCHCADNSGEKDSVVLCLKCGSGYRYKDGFWIKVLSFDSDAMLQILKVIEP